MHAAKGDVTRLLEDWSQGDPEALDRLMPLVFDELREMARNYLREESAAPTLQPTALVHELYLRLHGRRTVQWKNRQHFFGTLAGMMRRILVDHARRRLSARRGTGGRKISLDQVELTKVRAPEMVALDDALEALGAADPRKCRIVELRFFTGLTHEEIAR
ncbi:MAG: RNA polymerase subunit sigma-70, partial [bacterium]|nr:RNA polymerase subunit sigma-70 [bacterium]